MIIVIIILFALSAWIVSLLGVSSNNDGFFILTCLVCCAISGGGLFLIKLFEEKKKARIQKHQDEIKTRLRTQNKNRTSQRHLERVFFRCSNLTKEYAGKFEGYVILEPCDLKGNETIAVYNTNDEWLGHLRNSPVWLLARIKKLKKCTIKGTIEDKGEYMWADAHIDIDSPLSFK